MKHSFNMENTNDKEQKPKATGPINSDSPPAKKEAAPVIDNAMLQQILDSQQKLASENLELNRKLAEMTTNSSSDALLRAVRELMGDKNKVTGSKVLDPNDYDEKGTSFFYYNFMTVLSSDRRMNQEVLAPYGPIIFEHLSGISREEGKEQNILYICGYTSHSKNEIQWIRDHTWYKNGLIGEKFNTDTTKKQVLRSQRAAKYLGNINAWAPSRVMQECNSLKIDIKHCHDDLQSCRALLVEYFVDKEVNDEVSRAEKIVKEQSRDEHMKDVTLAEA